MNEVERMGVSAAPSGKLEEFLEMYSEYLANDLTLDPSLPVRHPNRNVSKGENSFNGKENKRESDKTVELASADDVKTEAEELPGILNKEIFLELAGFRSSCCATVYLPTHQAGVEVNERLKPARTLQKYVAGLHIIWQDISGFICLSWYHKRLA